jgi:hypothetical protein
VQLNGTVLAPTLEAHKSVFIAAIAGWKQRGWSGTKLLEVKATMLSPSAALIKAEWTFWGANGIALDGCRVQPYTYLAAKTQDGWKFLSTNTGACKARLSCYLLQDGGTRWRRHWRSRVA